MSQHSEDNPNLVRPDVARQLFAAPLLVPWVLYLASTAVAETCNPAPSMRERGGSKRLREVSQDHTATNDRYKLGFPGWGQGRSPVVGSLHRHAGGMGREVLKFPRDQEAAASFCLQVWQSLGLWASVSTRSHPPYSLVPSSSRLYWLYLYCYALLPIVDWLGTDLFLLSQPIEICFCPSYHVVTVTKLGLAASGIYGRDTQSRDQTCFCH